MIPLLANGIDLPVVLVFGLVVAIPLLFFQTIAEAFVLARLWRLPSRDLRKLTLTANITSLLAGIPTKIGNAVLYSALLPGDLPRFFARYPWAVALGTLIYFIVTVAVEALCAFQWTRSGALGLKRRQIWEGVLFANIATYIVMAPLHYYVTKPTSNVREFTADVRWASNPNTRLVFLNVETAHLTTQLLGETTSVTVAAVPMMDFIVSSNLNVCLYRSKEGELCLWRNEPALKCVVWPGRDQFVMDQVAFSPSGNLIAFAPDDCNYVDVFDAMSQMRWRSSFTTSLSDPLVAWTLQEEAFVVRDRASNLTWRVQVTSNELKIVPVQKVDNAELLPCYGRFIANVRHSRPDFQKWYFDDCGEISARVAHGLASSLRIKGKVGNKSNAVVKVAANPGLLHLGGIRFSEVAFLQGCGECLFVASDHIYLLAVTRRRVGMVGSGKRVVPLTSRFLKTINSTNSPPLVSSMPLE